MKQLEELIARMPHTEVGDYWATQHKPEQCWHCQLFALLPLLAKREETMIQTCKEMCADYIHRNDTGQEAIWPTVESVRTEAEKRLNV